MPAAVHVRCFFFFFTARPKRFPCRQEETLGSVPPRRAHREQRPEQTPNPRHPGGQQSPGVAAGVPWVLWGPHTGDTRGDNPRERASANRVGGTPGGSGCAYGGVVIGEGLSGVPRRRWPPGVRGAGLAGGGGHGKKGRGGGSGVPGAGVGPRRNPRRDRSASTVPAALLHFPANVRRRRRRPGEPRRWHRTPRLAHRPRRAAPKSRPGPQRRGAAEPPSSAPVPLLPSLLLQRGPEPPEPRYGRRRRRGKGAG